MKKYSSVIYFNALILLSGALYSQTELNAEKIFDLVDNSVVVILAYDSQGNIFQGSGVVISNNGMVATNYHVIKGANRIEIKHYSKDYRNIETVYSDEQKDILILRSPYLRLKPVEFSSANILKTGQRVYAIGSPEGYENSISEGIISGFRTDENNVTLIQMTTPITEGSSGGAVVNSYGQLIGLSMSGQHEGSLYFALPVSELTDIINNKSITTETDNTENYFESGTIANEKENYKEAEFYFTKYLDKFSNDVAAYYNRGYARFKLKEYKNAISDFDKVLDYDKLDYKSYFYRANCYYFSIDYRSAYNDYTNSLMLDSSDADIYYNRGFASMKLNDLSGAISDWKKAIELNPEYEKELSLKINSAQNKLNNKK